MGSVEREVSNNWFVHECGWDRANGEYHRRDEEWNERDFGTGRTV